MHEDVKAMIQLYIVQELYSSFTAIALARRFRGPGDPWPALARGSRGQGGGPWLALVRRCTS